MENNKRDAFQDKFSLLNQSERTLYNMLCKAAPDYIVFSQVSMSQIFYIPAYKKFQVNTIGKKSVDFLLCRKDDTSIVLAVELNGPMHEKDEQKISDETKRAALTEAGIPLYVIEANDIPNQKDLGRQLAKRVVDRKKNEEAKKEALLQASIKKAGAACASCSTPVSLGVANYCKSNATRFGGKVLCQECQPQYGKQ